MYKPGDKIRVVTKDTEFIGLLMPNERTESLVIKLENGYNIGIDRANIKKVELVNSYNKSLK